MFNTQAHQRENHGRGHWLSTVINPSTPRPDAHQPLRAETNFSQHGPVFGSLYSFDPSNALSNFSTPSLEAAQFDYRQDYDNIVHNTYGEPYMPGSPEAETFAHRASSDDNLPPSVHQVVMKDRAAAGPFSVNTQELGHEKPGRKAHMYAGRSQINDIEKENQPLAQSTAEQKKKGAKSKLSPVAYQALNEAVWEADPFSAPHGELLKRWDLVATYIYSRGHLESMKVPALRMTMERLLVWQHELETDEGTQIDGVLKGTREAITMSALLDKISQSKENAEGRTEEQKTKAAKKDDYDKKGGEAIRLNSLKSMRQPGSPAGPTSPRHYIPPVKPKNVVVVNSSGSDTSRASSPSRGSTPEVQELPPPVKGLKRRRSSQGTSRRHKRSRFFREETDFLDPLLVALHDGQEQQRRSNRSLEKKLAKTVEKQNKAIRDQTTQYVGILQQLTAAITKN
ncbi:hypothetical protein C8R44DRAFT_894680 [Mycena epipterygia]|nr:hypothetical protein C8R44DRAFT_894680 [Mycena epipterygia]